MVKNEQVLVFPTKFLHDEKFYFQGFRKIALKSDEEFLDKLMCYSELQYIDREIAEKSPEWKQIIPYIVLKKDNKIFCYKRTKKGGESRLHDMWSLGIGGHINPLDEEDKTRLFENGLFRELFEEVGIKGNYSFSIWGFINDDSNNVGQVHYGVACVVNLTQNIELRINDPALSNGDFESLDNIKKNKDMFENWSKLIIDELC